MRRRSFLQGLGLGAGGLLLPSHHVARASTPAKRIIFFVTSHGTVYDRWRMRLGNADDVDYELSLPGVPAESWSPILAPLQPHARKLLILDGLSNGCVVPTSFDEHEEGHATLLTGRVPIYVPGGEGRPDGASVDQIIAASQTTPFPSLEWATGAGLAVNFDELGQAIPYEYDPLVAWDRLFPSGLPGVEEPTVAARIRARQDSVLDRAAQRYEALLPKLSADDRVKLGQHRDLVRDLEVRVRTLAELACEPSDQPDWPAAHYTDADFPNQMASRWFDLTAGALACGLSNVITLRFDHVNNSTIDAPPGDIHNDFAHQAYSGDTPAGEVMTAYGIWQAEKFAELLALLDSIPEGFGSLLDHTVVVWVSEIATGQHSYLNHPVVVAGGTDFFDTGRVVRWGTQNSWSMQGGADIGPPHNRLLQTLAASMGLDLNGVGNPTLPGAHVPISTTGILDRVVLG